MSCDWQTGRAYPQLNSLTTKNRFKDYVVLVAGGCSGIGRATVERFANDGAIVYALDIRIQGVDELKEKFGDRVKCVYIDVTNTDLCHSTLADIASEHNNTIDCLVNCVAYFGTKGIDATDDDWNKSLTVNVRGYASMTQAVAKYMKTAAAPSIINVSSISAHRCQPNRWTYAATKGAIDQMTRCMALDLGKLYKIRVNSVSPGWIWSPEGAKPFKDREEGDAVAGQFSFSGRNGEVEEAAAAITFLASKDASFITGADLPVDGGYLAMGPEGRGDNSFFAGDLPQD